MKQNKPCFNFLSPLALKKTGALHNFSTPLLYFISKNNTKRVFIEVQTSVLDFFSSAFSSSLDTNLCLLYNVDCFRGLVDFPNYYKEVNQRSISIISSGSSFVCLYNKELFKTNLFSGSLLNKKEITPLFDFERLVSLLDKFKYKKGSSLSFGFYVISGGIIDVLCGVTNKQYRFNFLDDVPVFYLVDIKSKLIKKNLKTVCLYSVDYKNKRSISDFKGVEFWKYQGSSLFLSRPQLKSLDVCSQDLDFQMFSAGFGGKKTRELPYNFEFGFSINGYSFCPGWFLDKNSPLVGKINDIDYLKNQDSFLQPGTTYIHEDFGYCLFVRIENMDYGDVAVFQFGDGLIKINIENLAKISFYSSGKNTALSFLNKPSFWRKKKDGAYRAAQEYVEGLLTTYAARQKIKRDPYMVSSKEVSVFVEAFKYRDTADQVLCWKDVCFDLGSPKPMNRLICGDVGFGKTEIAIRASFVATYSNKQTLVLAPTTILAHQLHSCFCARLNPFGVIVDLVCRTSKNKELSILNFVDKKTDVLIGTHSILNNKSLLSSCSLFIVDEEHRFGVKQKDAILNTNPSADLLFLSATPIPRTMQFALNNLSNMSIISTPPVSRKPVITSVLQNNRLVIKNAILKELERNGQVFFVDNSVNNLKKTFLWFKKEFRGATASIIYSKQPNKDLLKNMAVFKSKGSQVLFSTTIVESGIDLGAVNTIIINNAQNFGLSQLYQLRGRVGRSHKQAFSLLLLPNKPIGPIAKERIKSLIKLNSFGSNYSIAVKDLELRGFGALFGYKQTGTTGVGVSFYLKVLKDVLDKSVNLKNKVNISVCKVELYQPPQQKNNPLSVAQKLGIYKKIDGCQNLKELKSVQKTLSSFFGTFPNEVLHFYKNKTLSLLGTKAGFTLIVKKQKLVVLTYGNVLINEKLLIKTTQSFFLKNGVSFNFLYCDKVLTFKCSFVNKNMFNFLCAYLNRILSI